MMRLRGNLLHKVLCHMLLLGSGGLDSTGNTPAAVSESDCIMAKFEPEKPSRKVKLDL